MIKFITTIIIVLWSIGSFASGSCTGFFISDSGYVATAGHCHGKHISIIYKKGKQVIEKTAETIGLNVDDDVMIVKINESGVDYFTISARLYDYESVATMGFPRPDQLGYKTKFFYGRLRDNYGDRIAMELFACPGSSGSPVFNSNSAVIGVLVEGVPMTALGCGSSTRATSSINLLNLAREHNVPVTIDSRKGGEISENNKNSLYSKNLDKVVLIRID